MNKPEHKEFEKWAMPRLEKLQKIFLVEDHTPLTFEYNTKKPKVSECQYSYPYKSIAIRYSDYALEDWGKKNYEGVGRMLAHEMAHVVTDPFYTKAIDRYVGKQEIEDERERLTDHVANMVMKAKLISYE